jgi:hypothetical protein
MGRGHSVAREVGAPPPQASGKGNASNHGRAILRTSIFRSPKGPEFLNRHCEPTGRANARPMTGSAKQSISPREERMDCFVAYAPRSNDGEPCTHPHPRGAIASELCKLSSPDRGRGECRVPAAPAASCVKNKTHELVTTGPPGSPGIPTRVVLTASFVLSPVTGLSCHRRP